MEGYSQAKHEPKKKIEEPSKQTLNTIEENEKKRSALPKTTREVDELYNTWLESSNDLMFIAWLLSVNPDFKNYKQIIRESANKISSREEILAIYRIKRVDQLDTTNDINEWLQMNKDLLSPEMVEVADNEIIVAEFFKEKSKANELWKKITRTGDYHGKAAKEYEQILQKIKTDTAGLGGYFTLYNFDFSVNCGWAEKKLNLLYKRQEKFKEGQPVPKKHLKLREDYEWLDPAQSKPASDAYAQSVVDTFYSDYPNIPFISQDREKNFPHWIERDSEFVGIVSKENMTPLPNGLLPGHIWLLYWINEINHKRIPGYFEYQYGICFMDGVSLLKEKGYIKKDGSISKKGEQAINTYRSIITSH